MRLVLNSLGSMLVAAGLIACGEADTAGAGALEAASRNLRPSDERLAETYDRSCRSCHTIAATDAPLTGDRAAWSVRLDKGMTVLVDNVINGIGGMPPLGMCMDCGADEFEALIIFMAEAG